MAKVLVALAVAEPGENWKDERYKRDSTKEWIPGWELPKEWETEVPGDSATGVRKFGLLEVTYAGTPVPKARRERHPQPPIPHDRHLNVPTKLPPSYFRNKRTRKEARISVTAF